jgi:hypothetical protein
MKAWQTVLVSATIVIGFALPGHAGDLNWYRWLDTEGIDFSGFVDEMHAVRIMAGEGDRRLLFGDRQGQIHVLRFQEGRFSEEWVSRPLKSAIAEIFIEDVDGDGKLDIVAYSQFGDIAIYRSDDYRITWQSTEDMYASISAMAVVNVDEDPQMELVYCAEQRPNADAYRPSSHGSLDEMERQRESEISQLFIFDCKNLFLEWVSEPGLAAQSLLVADMDDDGVVEIVLNTGFVVDSMYRNIEWRYPDGFGQKLGAVDVDGDGIPELVGEYSSTTRPHTYLKFFDVDHQTESFLSPGR